MTKKKKRKKSAEKPAKDIAAHLPEDQQEKESHDIRRKKRRKAIRSFFLRLISLALVVYILVFHLVGLTVMPNGDMYPRVDAGDLLLFYRVDRHAKAQDIVVIDKAINKDFAAVNTTETDPGFLRKALNWLGFKDPGAPETTRFVCRVIAVAGDVVEVSEERGLIVNGNAVIEPNIFYATYPYPGAIEYPITLGPGEYFVMADSRNGGVDSRYFGPVAQDEIQGILITVLRRNNL